MPCKLTSKSGGWDPIGARTSGLCRPASSWQWCNGGCECDWTSTCCQCLFPGTPTTGVPPTGSNRHVPEPVPTATAMSWHVGALPVRRWSVGGDKTPADEFCRTLTVESGSPNSRTTRSCTWRTIATLSAQSSEQARWTSLLWHSSSSRSCIASITSLSGTALHADTWTGIQSHGHRKVTYPIQVHSQVQTVLFLNHVNTLN